MKTKLNLLTATVLCAALAGCAGMGQPNWEWEKAGVDQAQFQRDTAQCQYEITAATQGTDYSMRSIIGQELDRANRKYELGMLCMKAKGYAQHMIAG